ncbi:ArsR/SmtB family transcription factor [Patescibacteria group bacterium]
MKTCPNCFKTLSDKTRFKIVQELKRKKANVKDISSLFRLSQPTISHHLKVLKGLGILKSEKIGKEVYYFFNKEYSCSRCKIFKT